VNPRMPDDDRDPVLDACLEEVLGVVQPPDLAPGILRALARHPIEIEPGAAESGGLWIRSLGDAVDAACPDLSGDGDVAWPAPAIPIANGRSHAGGPARSTESDRMSAAGRGIPSPTTERRTRSWVGYAAALTVFVVASVGIVAWHGRSWDASPDRVAAGGGDSTEASGGDGARAGSSGARPLRRRMPDGVRPARAADPNLAATPPADADSGNPPLDTPFGKTTEPSLPASATASSRPLDAPPLDAPSGSEVLPAEAVIAGIDAGLRESWSRHALVPSERASDDAWCRRAFVGLLGRTPKDAEWAAFRAAPPETRRAALVERLVRGAEYADEFARHWATFWAESWIGRPSGARSSELASRDGFEAYLREAFAADRPFDAIVREVIAANGTSSPGSPSFNGAVNFLLAHHNADGTEATSAMTRLLLGRRFQCIQCHDAKSDGSSDGRTLLTQRAFWELNAFFGQIGIDRDPVSKVVRLEDRDMASDATFFEQSDGVKRVAYPVLPGGTPIARSGRVADGRRRETLAQWVARSDDLPRTVVNRVWAHLFGYGLTQPIDDWGPHNPATHPELLNMVSSQFAAHGSHLKDLVEWLALCDAFQRSEEPSEGNLADAPERGELPWFSRYYPKPARPATALDSLRWVAEARRRGGNQVDRSTFLAQFAVQMGRPHAARLIPADERRLPQSDRVEHHAMLRRLLDAALDPAEKIRHLHLAALGRRPSKAELDQCLAMLGDARQPDIVLNDIWWALLNSQETGVLAYWSGE